MSGNIDECIKKIFYDVQFNKTCHQSNIKKLKKCHAKTDSSSFWNCFESCFKIPLSINQRHPHVENTLEFVAKFATTLYPVSDTETEEPLCPFLLKLFDFIFTYHCAKDAGVRFRICHFLNLLLNSMGDQAFIDDDVCDKIIVTMMDRSMDKSPKVRAQAILALHRLQDPTDEECPVIKVYIFHATKDPKAIVRKAALKSMGRNQKTLQVALRRTRDVDEGVRKMAYDFISKVTVRSLTIMQRDKLLNDGLKDRSEVVRKTVENVLLPSWLRYFNGEFINLIRALDAEIGTDVSILALNVLFKTVELNTLIDQLPIDKDTRLIPINNLASENALYWKCLVKHIQQESTTDLERILPELSIFCGYISDYLTHISSRQNDKWINLMQQFVLLQLFEIATTYDLCDEVGRKKLNELICNTLISNNCSEKIIKCIVTHFKKVVPNANTRLDILANVISEIRLPLNKPDATQISEETQHEINVQRAKLKVKMLELKEEEYQAIQDKQYFKATALEKEISTLSDEITKLAKKPQIMCTPMEDVKEKDDPETMIKCLNIICTMTQSVSALTPTLRSLMQIVLDSLDHSHSKVQELAIKAIGIYCILDKDLAKQHIVTLFLQFSLDLENTNILNMTLKAIFDLLLLYGLEFFDISENENGRTINNGRSKTKLYNESDSLDSLMSLHKSRTEEGLNYNFTKILAGLLDNADQDLRTIATEGLCKLFLNRRITCTNLLSRIIILCFNPANDNDFYLRQCLSGFFDAFVTHIPYAQALLEEAYLPTLRALCNASELSPLQEIDPYDVSSFILNLIRLAVHKSGGAHYRAHNSISLTILTEILNPESKIDTIILIKSLKDLHVQLEDNTAKENLLTAIDNAASMITDTDKRSFKYIQLFKEQLSMSNAADVHADEDMNIEN